ncbi:hypothetical protein QAD02_005978 [Eretmocerus hayati]|uniref:Uncharacterized protein n=1 Tax=Eretmocerus hayati TaxID=131215 RepID=A0ACC2N0S8_9HYME|nr:hypothetical protein QAD02_005978 [Eretmocerus hayati]
MSILIFERSFFNSVSKKLKSFTILYIIWALFGFSLCQETTTPLPVGQPPEREQSLEDCATPSKFVCKYCESVFNKRRQLSIHIKKDHPGKNPFFCELCPKSFRRGESLRDHLRIHTGEKPFSCEICSKKFSTKNNFGTHMMTHANEEFSASVNLGEPLYSCNLCDSQFKYKLSLMYHVRSHEFATKFVCKICGKKYASNQKYKFHMGYHEAGISPPSSSRHHGRSKETTRGSMGYVEYHIDENVLPQSEYDEEFEINVPADHQTSSVLGQVDNTGASLHRPSAGHVTGTSSEPCGACSCSQDGAITQGNSCIFEQLELHQGGTESGAQVEHDQPGISIEAPSMGLDSFEFSSTYDQDSVLVQYVNCPTGGLVRVEPQGQARQWEESLQNCIVLDTFTCRICLRSFNENRILVSHVKRLHPGVNPYWCNICDKSFSSKTNLQGHITSHTGEKPFACEICSKKFNTKRKLGIHMRTHADQRFFARASPGELLYPCQLCDSKFKHEMSLRYHLKSHEFATKFICHFCGRKFACNQNLKKHIMKHHDSKGSLSSFNSYYCGPIENTNGLMGQVQYHIFEDHTSQLEINDEYQEPPEIVQLEHIGTQPHRASAGHGSRTSSESCGACSCGRNGFVKQGETCIFDQFGEFSQAGLGPDSEVEFGMSIEAPLMDPIDYSSPYFQNSDMVQHVGGLLEAPIGTEPQGRATGPEQWTQDCAVSETFICRICSKNLYDRRQLTSHIKKCHPGVEPYWCNICNKSFSTAAILRGHIKAHFGEGPFACEICLKRFSTKNNFGTHMMTHANQRFSANANPGEVLYSCEICDANFKHILSLRYHVISHEFATKFVCKVCGKKLACNQNLKRHIRKYHKDGESPLLSNTHYGGTMQSTSGSREYVKYHIDAAHPSELEYNDSEPPVIVQLEDSGTQSHRASAGHGTGTSSESCGACSCGQNAVVKPGETCIFDQFGEFSQTGLGPDSEVERGMSIESSWIGLDPIDFLTPYDQDSEMMQHVDGSVEALIGAEPQGKRIPVLKSSLL